MTILLFPIGPKNNIFEKSKISQPIGGQGSHPGFPIGLKYTNLVEDVEVLLLVTFRLFPFREGGGIFSAKQRPWRPETRT